MISYNNIVTRFETFVANHKFLRQFSHGSIEDADLKKEVEYPLLHLVYTGSDYSDRTIENWGTTKTYNLSVFILTLPPDHEDKVSYQKEAISDCQKIAEDILADIYNGGNVFTFNSEYFVEGVSLSPVEEENSNVLAGVLLEFSLITPFDRNACDLPLEGVDEPGLVDCEDATYQNSDGTFVQAIGSGETFTSDDITVTQVDGTEKDVPSNKDVTCLWKELQLDASDGVDIFIDGQSNNDVSSYPSGGVITVSDLTIRDGDGFSQAYPRRQRVVISGAAIQSVSQDAASTTITVPTVLPIDLVNGASGTVATILVDPSGTYTLPDLTVNGSGSHAIPTTNIQVNQADGSAATINSVTEGASQLTIVVPNEGVTAATKLLDETGVGSALMAFSVRKLRDNYTGAALRVRRASDNDEADIFFEGEDLNIDQLESFCSGTNGFVTTWYDQSNNGHDFTRSIAGSQPQIVSNGSAILENGKVAMQYDGTSDSLLNSDTIKATPSNYTVSAVHNRSDFNAYLFDTQTGRLIFDRTGFAYWFDGSNQGAGFTHTAQAHVLLRLVSTGGEARKDGASIATGLSYTQKAISGQQAIGAVYTGGGSRMTGTIQEFIVWDADKNSAVSTIETNVNNYFSVY